MLNTIMSQASTWSASHVLNFVSRLHHYHTYHAYISLHRSHVLTANDAAVWPPESDSRNYLTTLTFHSSLPGQTQRDGVTPIQATNRCFPARPTTTRFFFSCKRATHLLEEVCTQSHTTHTERRGFWFGWILHDAMPRSRVIGHVSEATSKNCLLAEPN